MLIKALCDYYDILAKNNQVLPDGFSKMKIHYLISLTPNGEIDDLIDIQKTVSVPYGKGKSKEIKYPAELLLPKRTQKTGIDANICEHRPLYIFGLNFVDGVLTTEDKTQKAKKSHDELIMKSLDFFEELDTPIVNAYKKFMESWCPSEQTENSYLTALGKGYDKAGFAFCLSGHPETTLHEDRDVLHKWLNFADSATTDEQTVCAQCAITGETLPIARIHDSIKNVAGGNSTGNVLVCFKNPSETSYGNTQSYNSNISVKAMKKYTEALNYLLSDQSHKTVLDNMNIVYWSMSDQPYADSFVGAALFDDTMGSEETQQKLHQIFEDAGQGVLTKQDLKLPEQIDENTDFYMVGLKPNSSRLSVKFIYRKKMGDLLVNIAQHQADLRISKNSKTVPLWRLRRELISPKSSAGEVDPALMSKILQSIVYGYNYPEFLLYTAVNRVKTDQDDETKKYAKLNDIRVGIIKACINRKSRLQGQREEIKMALDKENRNQAYLCGRLFAALEKLQNDASNNSLNRTIKDAYFASAASKPSLVFPKLIKLAQNHLPKAHYGDYWNYTIGEIINKLGGTFPDTLTLADQGKFIIGYYQQFFEEKKDNKQEEE